MIDCQAPSSRSFHPQRSFRTPLGGARESIQTQVILLYIVLGLQLGKHWIKTGLNLLFYGILGAKCHLMTLGEIYLVGWIIRNVYLGWGCGWWQWKSGWMRDRKKVKVYLPDLPVCLFLRHRKKNQEHIDSLNIYTRFQGILYWKRTFSEQSHI